MADSSEPAFLFLYRKEAVAPVDYLSTFATAPFFLLLIYGIHFCQYAAQSVHGNLLIHVLAPGLG